MNKMRIVSVLLIVSQLLSLSILPVYAEDSSENIDYSVVFCNDGVAEEWKLSDETAGEIQQLEEDGNEITRLKTKSLVWDSRVPSMKIDLGENKIKFKDGEKITIETKIRAKSINQNNGRITLKYNTDSKVDFAGNTDGYVDFWVARNYLVLAGIGWEKSVPRTAFLMPKGTVKTGTVYQNSIAWEKMNYNDPNAHLSENLLDGETWITMKVELDKLANKAEYTVSWDNHAMKYSTNNLGVYPVNDYLENLVIDNIVEQVEYIDVDYIKVKGYKENAKAELLGYEENNGVKEIKLDDDFKIGFDLPMDESTLTPENVKLFNSDTGDEVLLDSVSYNPQTMTATITPKNDMAHGNYVISLSDGIKTADIYPDREKPWIPLEGVSFSFRYYATNPSVVSNVEISGNSIVGAVITSRYVYENEDNIPEWSEGSLHKWYISSEKDGEYELIADETENKLTILEEYCNKFIKLGITPKDETGFEGVEVFSEAFAAPSVPKAEDVYISGALVKGKSITANYTFNDANGDKEGKSLYQWYISEKKDDGFVAIDGAVEKSYTLDDESVGKFIKVEITPVSLNIPYEGKKILSASFGPVENSLEESTNMVTSNADLELGTTAGWYSGSDNEITITEDAHSGKYALSVKTANKAWGYANVKMEANTAYLVSMWIKSPEAVSAFYLYSWQGGRNKDFDSLNYNSSAKEGTGITVGSGTTIGKEWIRATDVMVAYNGFYSTPTFIPWMLSNNIIVDDIYVGKLMIDDIKVDIPKEINIPSSGEYKVTLKNPKVTNQLGTTYGFDGVTVKFEVPENELGARIEEDDNGVQTLVVTELASVGTLNLKAMSDPYGDTGSVKYAGVETFETIIPIELTGSGSSVPKILDASLTGTVNSGDVINLDYTFYQLYGESDKSEISWWYSETKKGEYQEIENENKKFYVVPKEKANGYFKVKILPKTQSETGVPIWSNAVGAPEAPVASDITVSGNSFVGETLTGEYKYSDFNNDAENGTEIRWLRADEEDGEYREIEGEKGTTYVLTMEDKDKYIKFEVTPISDVEPKVGVATTGSVFKGPKAPVAKNVKITKHGKMYEGSYDYYQEAGAYEGKTTYKWIVDGKVVSTSISYMPEFKGKKDITFEVTPRSVKEPETGEPVSATVTVTYSGTSGGGGGGSSGGSPSMIFGNTTSNTVTQPVVPSIVVPETEKEVKQSDAVTDIKEHWGYDAVCWAIDNNIMDKKTELTFEPDAFATRREIITYFAKILEWERAEYQNVFEDVEAGDFAELLQTFVDKGVISVDNNFRPDDNLTREELCKILAIALQMSAEGEKTVFDDDNEIGKWAIPYVNAVYEEGLIKGVGNNRFEPKGNVTRAQLATLLLRISTTMGE